MCLCKQTTGYKGMAPCQFYVIFALCNLPKLPLLPKYTVGCSMFILLYVHVPPPMAGKFESTFLQTLILQVIAYWQKLIYENNK